MLARKRNGPFRSGGGRVAVGVLVPNRARPELKIIWVGGGP